MKKKNYGWSKKEIKLFTKLYPTTSIDDLIKTFPNKTKHVIYSYATLKGLKKKDRGKGQRNGSLKILFNGSSQSLYWIGFLFADGCINKENRICVSSSSKDKDHMKLFADYISSNVYKCKNKGGTKINLHSFCTYSVRINDPFESNKLMKNFDFKHRKTYNPPSIKILQKQLNTKEKFISFFVGFIDGDGWISLNKNTLKSSLCLENHSSWLDIHNWFISQLKFYKLYEGKSFAKLHCGSRNSTILTNKKFSKFQLYSNVVENIKKDIQKLKLKVLIRKWNKKS